MAKSALILAVCLILLNAKQVFSKPSSKACTSACCKNGGWCGDAVFDSCSSDKEWNYKIKCSPSWKTCCIKKGSNNGQTTVKPTGKPGTTTNNWGSVTVPPSWKPPTWTIPSLGFMCGKAQIKPKIVGGSEAIPHSWPWQVSLEDNIGMNQWMHFCGGTLISTDWVVTACHCVYGYDWGLSKLRVVLGMHNRYASESSVRKVGVKQIFMHPKWSKAVKGSPYDIALLQLETSQQFDDYIQPACLPTTGNQQFLPDDDCVITGWGDTKGTGSATVLRELQIKITPFPECYKKWIAGTGGKEYIKEYSHVCVGNGLIGSCNGDSGGPLQCKVNGTWTLAGVATFGAGGCKADNAPDVYTNVALFGKWVVDTIKQAE